MITECKKIALCAILTLTALLSTSENHAMVGSSDRFENLKKNAVHYGKPLSVVGLLGGYVALNKPMNDSVSSLFNRNSDITPSGVSGFSFLTNAVISGCQLKKRLHQNRDERGTKFWYAAPGASMIAAGTFLGLGHFAVQAWQGANGRSLTTSLADGALKGACFAGSSFFTGGVAAIAESKFEFDAEEAEKLHELKAQQAAAKEALRANEERIKAENR